MFYAYQVGIDYNRLRSIVTNVSDETIKAAETLVPDIHLRAMDILAMAGIIVTGNFNIGVMNTNKPINEQAKGKIIRLEEQLGVPIAVEEIK